MASDPTPSFPAKKAAEDPFPATSEDGEGASAPVVKAEAQSAADEMPAPESAADKKPPRQKLPRKMKKGKK